MNVDCQDIELYFYYGKIWTSKTNQLYEFHIYFSNTNLWYVMYTIK